MSQLLLESTVLCVVFTIYIPPVSRVVWYKQMRRVLYCIFWRKSLHILWLTSIVCVSYYQRQQYSVSMTRRLERMTTKKRVDSSISLEGRDTQVFSFQNTSKKLRNRSWFFFSGNPLGPFFEVFAIRFYRVVLIWKGRQQKIVFLLCCCYCCHLLLLLFVVVRYHYLFIGRIYW